MKLLRTLIIASLLAASFAFLPALPNASAACLSSSGDGDADVTFGPFSMPAGSSITATMTAYDGDGTAIALEVNGSLEEFSVEYFTPHTYTFTFASQTDNVEVILDWEYNGESENSFTISSSDCGGTQPIIPAQAVSGKFIETAEIYWAPGELIAPMTYIEAGKTYLVAGQDESGMYRKVLIACTWVWVRAETVVPNPDAPWFGKALPTTIVEAGDSNACAVGSGSPVAPFFEEDDRETAQEA